MSYRASGANRGEPPRRDGPRPNGRPPIILDGYDPETGAWSLQSPAGHVLAAIRNGAHRYAAFNRAGLSRSTGDVWMARGREHRPTDEFDQTAIPPEHLPYVRFVCAVERRDAEYEVELTEVVQKYALRNGPFALTLLARKYSHWRDKNRAAVLVDPDGTPTAPEGMSNADLLALLRAHPEVVEIADRLETLFTDVDD